MIFSTAFLSAAVPLAVLVLTTTVWIAAATGTATIFFGALLSQPNISYAVFRHLLPLVGVGNGVIDRVLTGFRIIGGTGQGAGICTVAIADGRPDTGLREIGHGNGMRLAVCHAVITGHDRFRGGVGIAGVVTLAALFHADKAAIGGLR